MMLKKSAISTSIAGTRQRENFIVLMQHYDQALKLEQIALNSSGLAMERYGIYLEETESAMKTFKSTAEQLWQSTISSDVIQGVITIGTSLLEIANSIGLVNLVIPTAITLFASYNKTIRAYIAALIASKFAKDSETAAINANTAAKIANKIATTALTAAATFGLSAIATIGITAVTSAIMSMTNALEEQKQKVDTLSASANNLSTEIDNLQNKENTTKADELKIKNLERQLKLEEDLLRIEKEKLEVKEFEALGKGVQDVESGIKRLNKQITNTAEKQNAAFPEMANKMSGTALSIGELTESLIELEKTLLQNKDKLETFRDEKGNLAEEGKKLEEQIKKEEVAISDLYNRMSEFFGSSNNFDMSNVTDSIDESSDSMEVFKERMTDLSTKISDTVSELSTLGSAYATLSEGQELSADQLLDLIDKYPEVSSYVAKYGDTLLDNGNIVKRVFEIKKAAMIAEAEMEAEKTSSLIKSVDSQVEQFARASSAYLSYSGLVALSNKFMAEAGLDEEQMKAYDIALAKIEALKGIDIDDYVKSSSSASSASSTKDFTKDLEFQNNTIAILTESLDDLKRAYEKLDDTDFDNLNDNIKQQQNLLHQLANTTRDDVDSAFKQLQSMGFNKEFNDIFEVDANGVSGWKDMQTLLKWTDNQMKYLNNLNTEYGQTQVQALQKVKDALIDNIDSVQKLKDGYFDLGQEFKKNIELQTQHLNVESKIIEMIKKRYEIEAAAEKDSYDTKKENLNKQLNDYKDYIKDRLSALDELYNSEDYQKSISEQSDKITGIQSEISKYSLAAGSGDMEALVKVNDLQKELKSEQDKLRDMQTKRERELRKQNLNDEQDAYEKTIKAEEDKLNVSYDNYKDNLDEKLSASNLFLEAQKALTDGFIMDIDGKFVSVIDAYEIFEDRFGNGMSALGGVIKSEFIDKINEARAAVESLDSLANFFNGYN